MKKLTAGIFTVLLATVSMNANAAIPSKQYVDDKVGAEATLRAEADAAINDKIGTVTAGKTVAQMIADAQTAATTNNSALAERVTANENAIDAINNATTGIAAKAAEDATSKVNALATGAVADNTSAISALSTRMGTAEGKITTAEGKITTAEGKITTAETNIATNTSAISGLGTRMTAAEGKITAAETDIDNLQAADTAINDKIGTVAEGKTVVEMINDAQSAATYDDTALSNRVTTNKNAIDAINNATTGIAAVAAADATTKANKALADAKDYTDDQLVNYTNTTGMNSAISTAVADEATLRANADSAINTKIGTVADGKTVVQMISEAQSAATYNDAELRGKVTANTTAISNEVTARTNADNTINGRIDAITAAEDGSDGVQILTRKVVNGVTTYEWEAIERSSNNL